MGTGTAVATGEIITATKMNLKLESVEGTDLGSADYVSRKFLCNSFMYPDPGTDWTPSIDGAELSASKSAKKCWIPLSFLKVGDEITSYFLVGDATEATALTLDCKLVVISKGHPITESDVVGGAITQVTAGGSFDVEVDCTDTTVETDKQYILEIEGTTGAGDSITVMGAEVVVTRLL